MEKIASDNQPCADDVEDSIAIDDECVSLPATDNIMGKFWGTHHEVSYFLIRD